MFGFLNLDKPPGLTSRDALNRVQRIVRPHKVGHAGTLDPLATGVLVVAVGPATRLVEYVQRLPKTYQAKFRLGRTSDTEDVEGQVIELAAPPVPTIAQLEAATAALLGTTMQRPPAYSALKVAGRRAYELSRRGEAVELAPRPIEVHEIRILRYEYPELELRVRCGSGTYVRSLGRDLAEGLGSGAVMSALRRLAIGPFAVEDAVALDPLTLQEIQQHLQPPVAALADLPQVTVNEHELARIAHGQAIDNRWQVTAPETVAIDPGGTLAALLVPAGDHLLRPTKCFVSA